MNETKSAKIIDHKEKANKGSTVKFSDFQDFSKNRIDHSDYCIDELMNNTFNFRFKPYYSGDLLLDYYKTDFSRPPPINSIG